MNREIKFQFIIDGSKLSRAYSIRELLDVCETDILDNMEVCTCQFNESNNHCECEPEFEDSSVTGQRQFTGLRDRNGKDIYEWDIVAFVQEKNFVKGHIHPFVIEWKDYRNGMVGWSQFSPIDMVEVIGNIYETPDLLPLQETNGKG